MNRYSPRGYRTIRSTTFCSHASNILSLYILRSPLGVRVTSSTDSPRASFHHGLGTCSPPCHHATGFLSRRLAQYTIKLYPTQPHLVFQVTQANVPQGHHESRRSGKYGPPFKARLYHMICCIGSIFSRAYLGISRYPGQRDLCKATRCDRVAVPEGPNTLSLPGLAMLV